MVSEYLSCRALPMYCTSRTFVLISTRIIELPTLTLVTTHRFRQIDMRVETVKVEQNNRWYNENISKYLKVYARLKVFTAVFPKFRASSGLTSVSLGEHIRSFRKILLPSFSSRRTARRKILFHSKDKGSRVDPNVGICSPSDRTSQPVRQEFSFECTSSSASLHHEQQSG